MAEVNPEQLVPRVLYEAEAIDTRLAELADTVIDRYADAEVPPLFVCLLNGGVPFTDRLMKTVAQRAAARELDFYPEVQYMIISTYKDGVSADTPQLMSDVPRGTRIQDRTVVLLDDVLDTGVTLDFAAHHFTGKGAGNIESIVLVQKIKADDPAHPRATLSAFESPHGQWLIGVGMNKDPRFPGVNHREAGRWLDHIVIFEPPTTD